MSITIEKNVSLKAYTSLQVGGVADYFVVVKTVEELKEALRFAQQTSVPPFVFGDGTNILVGDKGFRGIVIQNKIGGIKYRQHEDITLLTSGAGLLLDDVVHETVTKQYWGLENLSAIPGTIGATPIQNVGAYGVEVSSLIVEVSAVHAVSLEEKKFSQSECKFAYRDSFFKSKIGREWIVTSVTYELSKKAAPQISYGSLSELSNNPNITSLEIREAVVAIRSTKFPDWKKVGTAGSFFKNPIISNKLFATVQTKYPAIPGYPAGEGATKVSLGWILDHVCKLKGYCKDGVCLYEHQALVLINQEAKDAATIETFASYVAEVVMEKTGITIEQEVQKI